MKITKPATGDRSRLGYNGGMNQIYGLVPVLEALRARRRPIHKILIASGANLSRFAELIENAQRAGVTVEERARRVLDELTHQAKHQGVVALVAPLNRAGAYVEADSILEALGELPLVVLLEGIEDPHNLGAILRVCEGAGVRGVFIPEHRAAGLNETVAKTSAGAVEYVPVARVTNLVPLIGELKERGLWVVGVEGNGETAYSEFDLNRPLALVFGSEGKGIRRLVREKCDAIISIPMRGQLNSLNVSVASGIVLFEAVRQREGRRSRPDGR
ncbi:MAG TPA: 23S rRNA (guanosine(2251)-2'-O)-methyltransferase RlmB [Blastocatellia bacterium]|nr:23S rRNA (guanosine(2251)-2'-O)-methyltransferase RlmB [Blastocatellia bacterium]